MSGFLRSDNIELAGLDHVPAPLLPVHGDGSTPPTSARVEPRDLAETPWIVVPSNDADRAAFVKELARSAVALGVRDAHPTIRGALEREHRRVTDGKSKPPSAEAEQSNVKPVTYEPWYQVTVWVCGAAEIVCCRSALTPMQFAERVYIDGLVVELTDGGVDSFDPASISRVRIEVHISKPPHDLRTVVFKTKRGARS